MTLYVTYCSADKDPSSGTLPALERYNSDRIQEIHESSQEEDGTFAILSGKFGLVDPRDEIPFYDKLLTEDDIEPLQSEVEEYLQRNEVNHVKYFSRPVKGVRKPYFQVISQACEKQGIEFVLEILE